MASVLRSANGDEALGIVGVSMRLAWVTGGRGFLGRHVARQLHATGWRVIGVGNGDWSGEEARSWGLELWCKAEIDLQALEGLAATAGRPDLIFHAVGGGSVGFSLEWPLADFQRTVATTAVVLEAARSLAPAALIVYPSSCAVYGMAGKGPISETTPLAPVSPYGVHKVMAENLCLSGNRHFGLRCAIIRYFSVYGPGLRKQLLWDLAHKIAANPQEVRLHGTGEETRDFLHAEDAARIVSLVADAARDQPLIINGGSGAAVSVRELAEGVAAQLGEQTVIRFTGQSRPGDPPHYQADISRLKRLGFTPAWALQDGLRDYVNWLRKADSGLGESG